MNTAEGRSEQRRITEPAPPGELGVRPEKELLYMLVRRELAREKGRGPVVDLACGPMRWAKSFPGRPYIGVDVMEEHISNGLRANPGATGICSSIEDLPPGVSGEFVLCLQCIGMNRFFDPGSTMPVVRKMIEATATGGKLLFNVGPLSQEYFQEIEALVTKSFGRIRVVPYGRFEAHRPPLTAWILSRLMYFFPPLARDDARDAKRLFVCEDRR